MSNDSEPCVAAICKCGNGVFLGVVKYLERKDRNELGRMAATGYTIRTLPASEARALGFGCKCSERKAP